MSLAECWVRHPQGVASRKAIVQVHLLSGLILVLYVLVMSVSGTILIYRRDLAKAFSAEPRVVAGPGPRLSPDELKQAALRAHPGFNVNRVFESRNPNQPVEIWLERGSQKTERLLNPYTGADLGNSLQLGFRVVLWLVDLHDNLLSGRAAHLLTAVCRASLTLLFPSVIVICCPEI